jgi:hypothetical protein
MAATHTSTISTEHDDMIVSAGPRFAALAVLTPRLPLTARRAAGLLLEKVSHLLLGPDHSNLRRELRAP